MLTQERMKEGKDKLRARGPVICTDGLASPPDEVLDWGYTVSHPLIYESAIESYHIWMCKDSSCVLECGCLYF